MKNRRNRCTTDNLPNLLSTLQKRFIGPKWWDFSAYISKKRLLHPNSTVSAMNISVLVAEVLSKMRSSFKKLSYNNIINVVSISASRIFAEKIHDQKIHDSIKNANNNNTNVLTQQVSSNSHLFSHFIAWIKLKSCN